MPVRAAPQRHLANRHAIRVSGSDSYALLFRLKSNCFSASDIFRKYFHLCVVLFGLLPRASSFDGELVRSFVDAFVPTVPLVAICFKYTSDLHETWQRR